MSLDNEEKVHAFERFGFLFKGIEEGREVLGFSSDSLLLLEEGLGAVT